MRGISTRELLQIYLRQNGDLEKINISELAKLFGVSRQRISQLLKEMGEKRQQIRKRKQQYCPVCDVPISRNARACRIHSHQRDNRIEGYKYRCRICGIFKELTEFTRSSRASSGYENRCLGCRSAWQREYNRTRRGRENHKKSVKSLMDKHPERRRAYYQVFKALKTGELTKEPCKNCGNIKSQAIHTSYSRPLDVKWLCRRCLKRSSHKTEEYVSNPLENKFRAYINQVFQTSNISGKWIASIKRYYKTTTLTKNILQNTQKDYKNILGLGIKYKGVIDDFLIQEFSEKTPTIRKKSTIPEIHVPKVQYTDKSDRKVQTEEFRTGIGHI